MQLYPNSIESKLGFDKIKALIHEACSCQLGKSLATTMQALAHFHTIDSLLTSTLELKQQIESGDPFPEIQAFELTKELKRSGVVGYFMPSDILFQLKLNLEIARQTVKYLKNKEVDYPHWNSRAGQIVIQQELFDRLNQVFDKDGSIRDHASAKLRKIRQEIKAKQSKARKVLDHVLNLVTEKGYSEKDSALTIRDGKLVVPILAEHKRRIKGLVIDESTTGKTVFIEPMEVVEQNNEIRELHFEENREIISILTSVTAQVASEKENLIFLEQFLGETDFTRAKAKISILLGAVKPSFTKSSDFRLINAIHPTLLLANKKLGIPVVPLNIEISAEQRIIVISGPNAGGKSVSIKTVGLIQLMLQSGMLVPVDERSSMGCYDSMFIDIGDEQSIESDLSTYSSHLGNMKYLLEHCSDWSLFLIDEFGTGTEPQFGGAIAESILSVLVARNARGLITTHYGNLKKFAEETQFITNAAMRFDLKKLVPQYILEVGRPGSSFALEIAGKIGLPEAVLTNAKNKIGQDPVAYEKLVSELQQEKQIYRENNLKNQGLKKTLEKQSAEFSRQLKELQEKEKEIINNAKIKARELLSEANQRIEATIRNIREHKAEKSITKKVRSELDEFKEKHKPSKPPKTGPKEVIPGPIKPGDLVRIKDNEARGEVLKVTGKSAEILIGSLKSKVNLNRLQKVGRVTRNVPEKVRSNIDLHRKRAGYSSQLDVRGFRAEEALKAVADFIDGGILLGMTDLRILHGKGDGILRTVIRERLQGDPSIASFGDEHVERGGAGVTLLTLK